MIGTYGGMKNGHWCFSQCPVALQSGKCSCSHRLRKGFNPTISMFGHELPVSVPVDQRLIDGEQVRAGILGALLLPDNLLRARHVAGVFHHCSDFVGYVAEHIGGSCFVRERRILLVGKVAMSVEPLALAPSAVARSPPACLLRPAHCRIHCRKHSPPETQVAAASA